MHVSRETVPVGRAVLVTGAASGIGRATARRLAARGTPLCLVDRDEEALTLVVKEIGEESEARTIRCGGDVAAADQVADAFATAERELGPLGGVVSAAGILRPGEVGDTTEADWTAQLAVNAGGAFHCLQGAARHLGDGGSVVVVGSNAARVPRTGMVAYAASKAAAAAATRVAGLELATRGVRCNVVEPGSTDTPMQRELWPDRTAGARAAIGGDPDRFRVGIPLRRIADPDDVAAVIEFLLSPAAAHVTLQQLFVDGGASL